MSAIPRPEFDTLILTCVEATDLALEGEVGDGYATLLAGLQRAREAVEFGEPWGEDMLTRWRRTVEEYAMRWGVGRA